MAKDIYDDVTSTFVRQRSYDGLTKVVLVDTAGTQFNAASSVATSVTRSNDTTDYGALDVVGAAAAALSFPLLGPSGGRIEIVSTSLEIDITAVISGMTSFVLHLYSVTPPSALADNAPFDIPSGDRASYLGFLALGTPVDYGSTLYVETNNIGKRVKLAGTGLFGYLVTTGAYTPAASSVFKITIHTKTL